MRPEEVVQQINRAVVVISALALSAVSVIAFLAAAEVVSPADVGPGGWVRDQLRELDALDGAERALAIAASLGAFLFGVLLVALQGVPILGGQRLYGTDATGNRILVDAGSIRLLIRRAAQAVDGVQSADARSRDSRDGVRIDCKATLDPSANMADVARALEQKIKADLTELAGIPVSRVRLKLQLGKASKEAPEASGESDSQD